MLVLYHTYLCHVCDATFYGVAEGCVLFVPTHVSKQNSKGVNISAVASGWGFD